MHEAMEPRPLNPVARSRAKLLAVCVALMGIQLFMLEYQSWVDSPTWDEVGHYAAAICHLEFDNFSIYCVNPPLVRLVAVAPTLLMKPATSFSAQDLSAPRYFRPEFGLGAQLANANGPRYFELMSVARQGALFFPLLGSAICFLWARDLFGEPAGLVALVLWIFSPSVLGYGHLITPDVGATAMGVAAVYCLRRWLVAPTTARAVGTGVVLGLALLTKMTWVVLVPLWPALWVSYRLFTPSDLKRWGCEGTQVILMLVLAVWVINAGYGFDGSFRRLKDYVFVSQILTGRSASQVDPPHFISGNRFRGSILGDLPVPVPDNYLYGIDLQKVDFENKSWSFLNGEWRLGGWWYYYLYAMLVKEPLGTWLLAAVAIGSAAKFRWMRSTNLGEEILLLVPAICVITLVSSQTGLNHHVRYVLPAFPFIFIGIARIARLINCQRVWPSVFAFALLSWTVISSVLVFPHSLSYFNELAGGPANGHYHLVNSNADWGQDLLYLKHWADRNGDCRPLYVAYDMPLIDLSLTGTTWQRISRQLAAEVADGHFPPGWYAVSVNQLHGRDGRFKHLLGLKPIAIVGYSTYIYKF